MRRTITAVAVTLACFAVEGIQTAHGQTTPAAGSMAVSASVSISCSITAADGLTFNQITGTGTESDTGKLTISCTRTFPGGTLTIGFSSNADGDLRRMKHETQESYIRYNLQTGTTSSGSLISTGANSFNLAVGTTTSASFDVYGVVIATSVTSAAAGSYSDTIPVTFTY